ncbi:MAG: HNH endonuclease [Pontimonas sp.]
MTFKNNQRKSGPKTNTGLHILADLRAVLSTLGQYSAKINIPYYLLFLSIRLIFSFVFKIFLFIIFSVFFLLGFCIPGFVFVFFVSIAGFIPVAVVFVILFPDEYMPRDSVDLLRFIGIILLTGYFFDYPLIQIAQHELTYLVFSILSTVFISYRTRMFRRTWTAIDDIPSGEDWAHFIVYGSLGLSGLGLLLVASSTEGTVESGYVTLGFGLMTAVFASFFTSKCRWAGQAALLGFLFGALVLGLLIRPSIGQVVSASPVLLYPLNNIDDAATALSEENGERIVFARLAGPGPRGGIRTGRSGIWKGPIATRLKNFGKSVLSIVNRNAFIPVKKVCQSLGKASSSILEGVRRLLRLIFGGNKNAKIASKARSATDSSTALERFLYGPYKNQRQNVTIINGQLVSRKLPKNGTWVGSVGNSAWRPNDKSLQALLGGRSVEFRHGFPDFRPFGKMTVSIPKVKGGAADRNAADKALAIQKGWINPNGRIDFRKIAEFKKDKYHWHHNIFGNREMVLLDKRIHSKISHSGTSIVQEKYGSRYYYKRN